MPIEIILTDNSKHKVNENYTEVSSSFKEGGVVDIDKTIFLKICEFVDYYLTLDTNVKKLLDAPDKLMDTNLEVYSWMDNFTNTDSYTLLLLISESTKLKINPLMNFSCFKLAQILNNNSIQKIREIFKQPV